MSNWWALDIVTNPGESDMSAVSYGFINADVVETLQPVSYEDVVNDRTVWYVGVTAPGVDSAANVILGTVGQKLSLSDSYEDLKTFLGGRDTA